ncbi:hypothetical protein CDG79_29950 [Nostoc sp. 'Peltigera membranacea cyanobiont' 232]|nr:hypothetical protein CDG79_29950 [Nostoc sp. 'Peltigera membranacea cyanobiont' 232]
MTFAIRQNGWEIKSNNDIQSNLMQFSVNSVSGQTINSSISSYQIENNYNLGTPLAPFQSHYYDDSLNNDIMGVLDNTSAEIILGKRYKN